MYPKTIHKYIIADIQIKYVFTLYYCLVLNPKIYKTLSPNKIQIHLIIKKIYIFLQSMILYKPFERQLFILHLNRTIQIIIELT